MAQYARPDSDVAAGSWTYSTGSTLYGVIDESSYDDADEMRINNASGTAQIGLSNVTDPSSSSGHVIRYRAMKTLAQPTLTVYLYQGTTQIASHTPILANGTYNTFTYTLSSSEADAITDYSDLRLHFAGDASGGAGHYARVSWAEFEVPDVGGSTYDDTVTVTRSVGVSNGGVGDWADTTSLSRAAGVAEGGGLDFGGTVTLSRSGRIGG